MHTPNSSPRGLQVACIVEENCIGCARCIAACPVDCIIGAEKFMHTVLRDDCIGCKLCIPACPVDCIVLQRAAATTPPFSPAKKSLFRRRAAHKRERELAAARRQPTPHDQRRLRDAIQAAVARKTAQLKRRNPRRTQS